MSVIAPTVTAYDIETYYQQLKLVTGLAERIHIDLMDGRFASTTSPRLQDIRIPHHTTTDIHLMYQEPMEALPQLIKLKPHMVVVHNEAHVHHMHFVAELHKHDIKAGLAILRDTPVEYAYQIMHSFDHVLIFSGNLGHHGGEADLGLLDKVQKVRQHHPDAEIGWDGGINDGNVRQLIDAGIDVLNVGSGIHGAKNPAEAYRKLRDIIEFKI